MRDDDLGAKNIREFVFVRRIIGAKLVDVTQTDQDEIDRGEKNCLTLLFDNGYTMEFEVANGFTITEVD